MGEAKPVMRTILAAAALFVSGCSASEPEANRTAVPEVSQQAAAQPGPAPPIVEPPEGNSAGPAVPPPEPAPKAALAEPLHEVGDLEAQDGPDLCWQDYCPCDPPQGGPDRGLCRQLRAGMAVDDELMAAAAMMRDARQQMADFEAEHGAPDTW